MDCKRQCWTCCWPGVRNRDCPSTEAFYTVCVDSGVDDVQRLARTVHAWWPRIEAFIRTRITNAASEGINPVLTPEGRLAYGFRNPVNNGYVPVVLLLGEGVAASTRLTSKSRYDGYQDNGQPFYNHCGKGDIVIEVDHFFWQTTYNCVKPGISSDRPGERSVGHRRGGIRRSQAHYPWRRGRAVASRPLRGTKSWCEAVLRRPRTNLFYAAPDRTLSTS